LNLSIKQKLRIAICIVGFRNVSDIECCLGALSNSTYTNFEIVICENGGESAVNALVNALSDRVAVEPPIMILSSPDNPGYAGGVNICIQATPHADAWWVLNPDTVPGLEALERMVTRLTLGDCDAVGSTLHGENNIVQSRGGVWRPWLSRAESLDHGVQRDGGRTAAKLDAKVNYLSGASMLVGRSFIDKAGLMREDYFLYAEEVEWCLRGKKLGCSLAVAPDAHVLHKQGTTTGSVNRLADRQKMPIYMDERNKILLTRDLFPAHLPIAAVAAFLLLFLRFARRGAWAQLTYGVSGWSAGVRNERGKPKWLRS
jgi:N-acetylglucosaminyl-diphospho-decaprenol L-rhamnosyltransferase